MIQFDETFFEGEERDGFYIEPMMKRVWAAQMEVVKDIEKVCQKYNLDYFADWGTLLGTIRHKGFVPWDDDMDICMRREDYMRFIAVAQKELPEGYAILNIHTEDDFPDMLTRIVNSRGIQIGEEHLQKFHGCPYAVGVDLFPLDYVPDDEEEEQTQLSLIKIVLETVNLIGAEYVEQERLDGMLASIEKMCGVELDRNGNLKKQLRILGEQLCCLYTKEDSNTLGSMVHLVKKRSIKLKFPKSCCERAIRMPFENIDMPVPVDYDTVLNAKYFQYMTPRRGSQNHNYPFYRKQENMLREYLKQNGLSGERFYL